MGVLTVDLAREKGRSLTVTFAAGGQGSFSYEPSWVYTPWRLLARISPAGWYDREKLRYCEFFDGEFRGTFDEASKRVFPRQVASGSRLFLKHGWHGIATEGGLRAVVHHEFLAQLVLPALSRIPIRAAMTQTAADQAAIACALERYRLANGHFPENLQALVPRFAAQLPNDVITGESFKYRPTVDDRFILYSVGWNEIDDYGVPGQTLFDETQGDWVWKYPPVG
jgi:hypothetical protein